MLPIEQTLLDLEQFGAPGAPVLSLYLLTDTATGPGRDLHAQLSELRHGLAREIGAEAASLAEFEAAMAAAARFIDRLDSPTRGLALFVQAGGGEPRSVRVATRLTPAGYWSATPVARPLRAALAEHERALVALIDKARARLFRVFMGEIEELPEVKGHVSPKHRQFGGSWSYPPPQWSQGGWGQSGLRRRHENMLHVHVSHVADELANLINTERIDRLVIGGAHEALIELRHQLSKPLRARLVGEIRVPLFAPAAEVLAAAKAALHDHDRAAEARRLDELVEAAGVGHAVFGAPAVIDAVNRLAVAELVVIPTATVAGGHCANCGHFVPTTAATPCPICANPITPSSDVKDAVIDAVLAQGGRLEEVHDHAAERLAVSGGVAAWLRHPIAEQSSALGSAGLEVPRYNPGSASGARHQPRR